MLLQSSIFLAFAFGGLYIHPVWVFGMLDLSPPDLSSPSSCSLLLQTSPQHYSSHWRMVVSSSSSAEKCRVQPMVSQARIQAEAWHICGGRVGLGLTAAGRSRSQLQQHCFTIPASQTMTQPRPCETPACCPLFTPRCWGRGFTDPLPAWLRPARLLGSKRGQ